MFGLLFNVGILWFLITLFTRQTNSTVSLGETWIVIIGAMVVGIMSRLLLGGVLGPFVVIIDIIALYFLVDKACGTPKQTTIKICGWYLGISFLSGLVSFILRHA
jgi:hypothetical protein